MRKAWTDDGWADYVYWQTEDKRTLKKINSLIKSIERDGPLKGEGHPEPLKYRPGYSRTINEKDRLVCSWRKMPRIKTWDKSLND